jgi:hypothetical protein
MDLGAIIGILTGPLLGAFGVDILPDPHAPKAVPPLNADAPIGRFVNEIADGTDDLPLFMVDAHGVIVTAASPRCRLSVGCASRVVRRQIVMGSSA